jgi:ribonuclease HI
LSYPVSLVPVRDNIGGAAYCQTTSETKHQYLGKDSEYNVYAAELTAIQLATEIVNTTQINTQTVVIYLDSQAAIKALVKPCQQSGQSII